MIDHDLFIVVLFVIVVISSGGCSGTSWVFLPKD